MTVVPTPLHEYAARCAEALRVRPAGLLTDIDGTISPIAPTPDSAVVSEDARRALTRLCERLDLVGAITGRAAENAEQMVRVPGMTFIGNHGMERRHLGQTTYAVDPETTAAAISDALVGIRELALAAGLEDGILYEDKGVTGSVHYRLAPDPDLALSTLLPISLAQTERTGLKVTQGRMVIELRPRVAINKGTSVTNLIESYGLNSVVFLGDDLTDVDGFVAVRSARTGGRVTGLNVAVGSPETNPVVVESADLVVAGVDECARLLEYIADALEAGR